MAKPTPPTYSGALAVERPADVTHWCATWHAFRATKTPRLCEYDVLAWIETLERTVAAQRTLLAEMREAMDTADACVRELRAGGDLGELTLAARRALAVSADGDA